MMKPYKNLIITTVSLALLSTSLSAAIAFTATYEFTGHNSPTADDNVLSVTAQPTGLTISDLSFGSGATEDNSLTNALGYGGGGSGLSSILSSNQYIEFTITPDAGVTFDVDSLSVTKLAGGNNDAFGVLWDLQVAPTTSNYIHRYFDHNGGTGTEVADFSGRWAEDALSSAITFRLYNNNGNPYYVDDLVISGTVTVPEPSTYAIMAGFMALGLVMVRRRMRQD